ncbi:MAG: MBOAT family protein, partial [Methylocystis sp.]|nr:MBOAT family protein [Methylocystis sp.]
QAALCYTAQLYFDFSGYSDMAIGLGRLFAVRLPANFDSPYASMSIIEFWRRWHMTLSRFLRDYVYIPLGGNRKGAALRYLNLFLTMLLGGLWHGAAYTFVIWGALHGFYLLAAHAWREMAPARMTAFVSRGSGVLGWLLTVLAVIVGWVFFRAASVHDALNILAGMIGLHGASSPAAPGAIVAALFLIIACAIAPNTQQIMRRHHPILYDQLQPRFFSRFVFSPTGAWAAFVGFGLVAVELFSWETSEFIYFQF